MIRTRADRLSRLLTDLLEYARAGSGELKYEVVHLPGLARDIAEMVDPDRRFEITFTGDRCVTSVKTPLRTILLNLVSNAIKHHDRDTGQVMLSHEARDGRTVITVADDGPGVPEQYQQKVFELFQTLKPSDEVEGSGMGLAMVRKLVSELGGDIVLRSLEESDRGATFIITLPLHDSSGVADRPVDEGEEGKAA
jgi:signal transduction histidine kinase